MREQTDRQTDRQTGRSNLRLTRKSAFTLVELLVVIVVIGILFAVLISRVDFAGDKAKTTGAMIDLRAYQTAATAAIQKYGAECNLNEYVAFINEHLDGKLKLSVNEGVVVSPTADPWGTCYRMEYLSSPAFAFLSAGPDLKLKTQDDAMVVVVGDNTEVQSQSFSSVTPLFVGDATTVAERTDAELVALSVLDLADKKIKAEASLEDTDWADIARISMCGIASAVFEIGDTKKVDDWLTVRIVGFDHDNVSGGLGKAGITFVASAIEKNELTYTKASSSFYGGWAQSSLREHCNNAIYSALPPDLREAIKTVDKTTDTGWYDDGGDVADFEGKLVTTKDKVWVPSIVELGVVSSSSDKTWLDGQGFTYEYYTDENSRIVLNASNVDVWYWTRSSLDAENESIHQGKYWGIDEEGVNHGGNYTASHYVVFGFCI